MRGDRLVILTHASAAAAWCWCYACSTIGGRGVVASVGGVPAPGVVV